MPYRRPRTCLTCDAELFRSRLVCPYCGRRIKILLAIGAVIAGALMKLL